MAEYRLSERAALDLEDVLYFSIERFGLERDERYKAGLDRCLLRLTNDPRIGRQLTGRASAHWRYTCQQHVIFFAPTSDGIFVVRVLHGAMDHKRHLL